ncbi:hypothetical protein [Chryseobacterium bernardetii]|uniref:hypothetical protein n=1 Tax=Chryseobacterium bernardetii TaxID=1241978 RepID=UPI003AF4DD58
MKLFDIMQFMADNNLDIRRFDTFVAGNKTKKGSELTMGADESTLLGLMNDKYIPVLFCVNAEQYKMLSAGITDINLLKEKK